ncbi:hypothetical protein TRAPUB_12114 [Trametes pubescens]|uniref:Uncharacterized protein n=1 Tax=Trametes pubescens TaxID=154538 RepID=A0A1M2VUS9_TRAPU|nr:hypothetical protein TRAPUB_12114 [Trametes pubescens]
MGDLVFPPHARGYLHYHLASNAPAISGQVRFRVTGINDPALFSSGKDLLRADYLPWRIPVISLPYKHIYTAMLQRLLDDGLVSEHVSRVASSLPHEARKINIGSRRIVHAFGQPFPLTFGVETQPFYFVGADTALQAHFSPVTIARDLTGTEMIPTITGTSHTHSARSATADFLDVLSGSALCCFEKSARPEHAGRRVVVCRVVRIVEPMRRTGFRAVPKSFVPREGELLRTQFFGDVDSPEWAFDIDHRLSSSPDKRTTQFAAGLDLLYDNEARAGGPVGW